MPFLQGMERVMNLQEQASRAHGDDDDDEDHTAVPRSGGDDGSHSGGKGEWSGYQMCADGAGDPVAGCLPFNS